MITAEGFSKDPNIIPEGIVITFGQKLFDEAGGGKNFMDFFEHHMKIGSIWHHRLKNKPLYDFDHVYIIESNYLYGRVFFGGYSKSPTSIIKANGTIETVESGQLLLSGPIEECPFERELKGFQGFRYCTKLF